MTKDNFGAKLSFMKSRFFLIGFVIFLAGCSFSFNQPAVGPDGTIAFFVNEEGRYHLFPESGTLALIQNGCKVLLENTTTQAQASSTAWSPDSKEIIYLETELGELGSSDTWKIKLTKPQTNSEVTTLWTSKEPILDPHFIPSGNITYLRGDVEEESVHLFIYNRSEDIHQLLFENVISYRPMGSGANLAIIHITEQGDLQLAHISTYDPVTGEMKELAKFFLSEKMQETFLLLPAWFLWDIEPSGTWLALTLYDRLLIEPEATGGEPTLYLIETTEETAEEIAPLGIAPAFSPDGKLLAYISRAEENEEEKVVVLYNLDTKEKKEIPGTENTSSLFWIDNETLGAVFEVDDKFSLAKYPLKTAKWLSLHDIPFA